jgi:hypothetical protein
MYGRAVGKDERDSGSRYENHESSLNISGIFYWFTLNYVEQNPSEAGKDPSFMKSERLL